MGWLQGVEEDGIRIFRGIPFAKPPVGERRFRRPEPAEPWAGVRDASRFGPSAPQTKLQIDFLPGMDVGEQSEDCLYLNVFAPAAGGPRRPVLVWIHGGAFTIGSGSQALYDVRPIVRRGDVIVVTINYRLGALGFLHLAELCGEDFADGANAGLLDQIAALGWVRDNIAGFGGDPGNVTIFGESAGGMSVGTLLGMPAARGLFQKAIAQSGAAHSANDAEGGDARRPHGLRRARPRAGRRRGRCAARRSRRCSRRRRAAPRAHRASSCCRSARWWMAACCPSRRSTRCAAGSRARSP